MARRKTKHEADFSPRVPMDRYRPDPEVGLTTQQAREYRINGWSNRPVVAQSKSVKDIVKSNVLTYFNFVFLSLGILLILVGAFRDLLFLVVIAANTMIGIIQELNAKRTLDKLTMLNAPRTLVLRDGKQHQIISERLVLDDIVIFKAGNQIPADAVVIDGDVTVNESLLTGESDEISKSSGDPLLSGSFIVSGTCKARLERVGEDSYISKLTLEAKAMKNKEQSEMIISLNRLLKIIGIIVIPIGIFMFVQQFVLAGNDIKSSMQSMVSAVIGMIPEGIFLLVSITLAVSTVRLGMKKVLVHDMKCIESLARVNVLCVDKTGTITENTMEVVGTAPISDGSKYSEEQLKRLIGDFAASMSTDNITMAALQAYYTENTGTGASKVFGFSSAYKYSAAVIDDIPFVLGAPEFVLRDSYDRYRDRIEEYGNQGIRVLVFGKYSGILDGLALTGAVLPLALIMIANPIRPDAKETFRFFEEQGVEIKVISGDNPVTVSKVAMEAGIANAERYIDASELTDYEMIKSAVTKYAVFGRVTPGQKRDFINALKENGKTVAMTGDGVNDVLALKDADCSVAMASGSDAAAQAAQLVLLESDFARMPDVVMEGRQVVNNLERAGSLFLVKNIFTLLVAIFSMAFSLSFPIQPSQLTMISFFTIGMPGFFLSQIPNTKIIEGHFLSNIIIRALPGGMTDAIIVAALVIFGDVFNVGSVDISTAATILLCIVGFIILYQICKPMDFGKWMIVLTAAGGMIFACVFMSNMFGISGMSTRCVMLFILFSVITEPLLRYLTRAVNFLRDVIEKQIAKYKEGKAA